MGGLTTLFILKLLDTAISSLKNIFMIKGFRFLSALSNSISYLFYILLMKQLLSDTSVASVSVTLLAVFLGQYLAQYLADKFEKDKVWKISITPETKEESLIIAELLRNNNIPTQTYKCYNSFKQEVLGINAFAETKADSSVINSVLSDYQVKINITEIRNRI